MILSATPDLSQCVTNATIRGGGIRMVAKIAAHVLL